MVYFHPFLEVSRLNLQLFWLSTRYQDAAMDTIESFHRADAILFTLNYGSEQAAGYSLCDKIVANHLSCGNKFGRRLSQFSQDFQQDVV